ncbi:MAG: nucleotidyl transferase AbiEii/AbiGii toxin family protein [Nitrospirota bacterium]|nr:nucleotidyl transferase AbiEii/AbiGii toxin family protein [Nitrospirota bacterium]
MHRECFPEEGWQVLRALKKMLSKYHAIMAGGTSLAVQIGHRISEDLDFFTNEEFHIELVISAIRKTKLPFRLISEEEGSLITEVKGIKISLLRYDYPFLDKPVIYEGIKIAGILDIASMKVIAISQRGTKRDFVDLYFILQDIPFHKIAEHMVKRFGKERLNPVSIGKSLVYFSDAESNPEPQYIKGNAQDWDKIKKFFKGHVKQFVFDLDTALKS